MVQWAQLLLQCCGACCTANRQRPDQYLLHTGWRMIVSHSNLEFIYKETQGNCLMSVEQLEKIRSNQATL
ncbi:hypothetical protein WJX84_000481 [Apatococcus fuscideae]|uniref:Secreted protein n=1 Tax=Apatococcus fuscideae TaxID=2026836 RepID=A0AAW1T8R9_9CHLO